MSAPAHHDAPEVTSPRVVQLKRSLGGLAFAAQEAMLAPARGGGTAAADTEADVERKTTNGMDTPVQRECPEGTSADQEGECAAPTLSPEVSDLLARTRSWPSYVQNKFEGDEGLRQQLAERAVAYFGSADAAEAHYQSMTATGHRVLHRDAAGPFDAACAEFQSETGRDAPVYGVAALGFEYRLDAPLSGSNVHPLGYAVDLPDTPANPHLKQNTEAGVGIASLIGVTTGGDYHAHRERGDDQTIEDMGSESEVTPEQDAFLARFQTEVERMNEASQTFQASLGDNPEEFLTLYREYQSASRARKTEIVAELPRLLAPWFDRIREALAEIDLAEADRAAPANLEAEAAEMEGTLAEVDAALAAWEAELGLEPFGYESGRLRVAEEALTDPAERARAAELREAIAPFMAHVADAEQVLGIIASVDDGLEPRLARIQEQDGSSEGMDRSQERERLVRLSEMLATGEFVFEGDTEKRNPALGQMVEQGFSNQDPVFMRILARHGFRWGGVWDSPDFMHVELVR